MSIEILTSSRHQQDGTQFILQREDPTNSIDLSARLCQSFGIHCAEAEGKEVALGGLVADVMGLGKTLTTLVSILRSTEKAVEFGHFNYQMRSVGGKTAPTKATLVVVPSARKCMRSHLGIEKEKKEELPLDLC